MTTPNERNPSRTAILLIAHGSRRAEANAELQTIAEALRSRGRYAIVRISYLELAEPSIAAGGEACVQAGAADVILLPFFLSPGRHVVEDLAVARDALAQKFTSVRFVLAGALGSHPSILDALEHRAREVETFD